MKFFKNWIPLLLISVVLSCYIRLYPLRAHIWDGTYDQATIAVAAKVKSMLLQQIHQERPDMPFNVAEQLATQKLNETLHHDARQFQATIEKVNRQMFEASGAKPNIYLLEADPYYFYNMTENIALHGKISDQIKGSKYLNPLMTAPFGYWQPVTYHPYVGFVIYKICQIFNPNIPLMSAVAFTPVVIMVFVLAAFFFACYLLGTGASAAFLSSLIFSLAPVILKRSSLGWFGTDPYNLFFPILLLAIIFKTFEKSSTNKFWILGIIYGIVLTAFAGIWPGWGFMLAMPLAILGACAFYSFITKNTPLIKNQLLLGLTILGATIVGISVIFGFHDFFALLKEGFGELMKFSIRKFDLWPNLFIEVGELKKSTVTDFLSDIGGLLIVLLCIASVLYTLWNTLRKKDLVLTHKIIALSVFLFVSIFLTIYAERFIIFTMIGLSLFMAIAFEDMLKKIASFKMNWIVPLVVGVLGFILFSFGQQNIRTSLTPIYNAVWEKALLDIKNKTPDDSIINSWWPPGHFIKAIAHRRVMFDGATLGEGQTAYWMANILLSTDEEQAAGLLRMLNLSSTKAVGFLTSKKLKTSEAVSLLTTMSSRSRNQALELALAVLRNPDDARTLMSLTRGGSPHSYILLYNEMVDANLSLAFMGRWNIRKIEEINANPSLMASVPNRNSPAFIDFLWKLAGGPTRYSPPLQLIGQDDQKLMFSEGLVIEKSTMKALINSPTYGQGMPASTVYLNQGTIVESKNPQGNLKYSVVLYSVDGQLLARLMDQDIANSLLIKLFFFNAAGMNHFKSLTNSRDLTGRTEIKVFEAVY